MSTKTIARPQVSPSLPSTSELLDQYGCGPIRFAGTDSALYERHLLFDNVIDPAAASSRDRFEAVARAVRDVLSQRWVLTEKTYDKRNVKRLYYLSMEFLIGRSLANNVTNLLLAPLMKEAVQQKAVDWIDLLEQEPDAGLGNARFGATGLPASWNPRPQCNYPPWVTDLDTSTGSSSKVFGTAGSMRSPTIGCGVRTRGR